MKNSTNRKVGIILQFIQIFIYILISIIYTPYMLSKLGQDEYAVYSVCTSTISYLSLLSLGFSSSYVRFYYKAKQESDEKSIEKLNWHYLIIFSFFGIIALSVGLIMADNAQWFFNDSFNDEQVSLARKLMLVLAFNMGISFPATVFTSVISSQQKFIFLKSINIIKSVFSPLFCMILLMHGFGSFGMVLVTILMSVLVDFINVFYCIFKLKFKVYVCKFDFSFLKQIAFFSIFIGINQIVNQINFSSDKLILSKVAASGAVAIYSLGASLNTYFEQLGTAIPSVFDSKINKIIVSDMETDEKNFMINSLFIRIGRIQFFILSLIVLGFVFFGKYFISFWVGDEYMESYYVTCLLMIPMIIPLIQNTAVYIQRAKYKHKFRSILYLITAIINIIISIFLAKQFGAIGSALGTTIIILLSNLIINFYYQWKLDLNSIQFWIEIIKMIPGLIIPIVFGILINHFYSFKGVWDFIGFIIGFSISYVISMFFLGFNKSEKASVFIFLKKIKRSGIK